MDDDGEDGGEPPLALSAIPTELKQGEEQPASTVSPLSVMPEVCVQSYVPSLQWFYLILMIAGLLSCGNKTATGVI